VIDFILLAAFGVAALAGAAAMIVLRQPMRVAMALIWTMVCLGAIYGLLGVHFIAAFQVLIYVGAVMVFMVFVIMLLEVREASLAVHSRLLVPGLVGFVLLLLAVLAGVWNSLPAATGGIGQTAYGISRFSIAFLGEYWLHFELTSVLLLAAVVAALAIIKVNRKADGKTGTKARHG
jgi:NADH-quinone oxidoreductase subunit J